MREQSSIINSIQAAPRASSHCHDHDKIDAKEDNIATSRTTVSIVDCGHEEFEKDMFTAAKEDNNDQQMQEIK